MNSKYNKETIIDLDDLRKISIENYSIRNNKNCFRNNMMPSIQYRKTTHLEKCLKESIRNIQNKNNNSYKTNNNNFNKIKNNKLKLNENKIYRNSANAKNLYNSNNNIKQKNDFNNLKNNNITNTLILSNNNKINKKRTKTKLNIINTESNKSGNKNKVKVPNNNMTGKIIKSNKIVNKLATKDIIPFSMNNNNENNSELNNNNTLSIVNDNNNNAPNKKKKIYENHLNDFQQQDIKKSKTNDKEHNKKNKNNNNKILIQKVNTTSTIKKERPTYPSIEDLPQLNDNMNNSQNKNQLSNSINKNNSVSSSFTKPFKLNIKNNNNINNLIQKHFYIWYQQTYYDIIRYKLRSLHIFMNISNKIKAKQQYIFITKIKIYINALIIRKIKNLFTKYFIRKIKASMIKCHLSKMFNRYKSITFKGIIFRKLKEYLIRNRNRIYNEIERDIKNFNKDINIVFNYPRKKIIMNNYNKNKSVFNLYQNNKNSIYQNTNKSMLNLIHPQQGLILTQNYNNNVPDYYHCTEENQPLNFKTNEINNNMLFQKNNDKIPGKDIDIDMITKMNQLTMVINLIEQRLIKNKKDNIKKSLSLLYYFNRWRIITNYKKKINVIGEFTAPTDIDEGTQHTLNDIIQTESDLGIKSDHLRFNSSININSKNNNNKYIPVRGLKYFQGQIKQKVLQNNKVYNINGLIDQYTTNTHLPTKENNSEIYNKYDKKISDNNFNNNDNYRTFNDYKSIDYNNMMNNDTNKYLNINNMILKAKINDSQKNVNINNANTIYHRKTVGATFKTNVNNSMNNFSRINNTIYNNCQYTNDSINTTMENYYNLSGNFLGLLNNNSYIDNYKTDPHFSCNEKQNNNTEYLHGFRKVNKIEEREICFYPSNKNNNNINNDNKNDYKYNEDINIVNEIKKYYKEDIDIYINDIQKKKCNSFIINIFNNNIILTQEIKTKRSKSK